MPILAIVLATACWASTMVANKVAVEFLAVTEITGMRFLIGAVLMFLLAVTAGQLGGLRRIGPGPTVMDLLEPGMAALLSLLVLVTFERPPGYQDARKYLGDAITADKFLLEGFELDRAPHSGS